MVEIEFGVIVSSSIALASVVIALLSLIQSRDSEMRTEHNVLHEKVSNVKMYVDKEINNLSIRLTSVEQKVEIWWNIMEKEMIKLVKHPTELELDHLLDKYSNNTISSNELIQLKDILTFQLKEIEEKKDYGKGVAVSFLLASIYNKMEKKR